MDSLLAAMEQIVDDLYGHVHRVGAVATQIGDELGLSGEDLERLAIVGVFHDVGKVHVDPAVIAKPGPLTLPELRQMRRHPQYGYAMTVAHFDPAVSEAILYHHERWDGMGYPRGLAGTQIPVLARVVLVADAFDAITSTRSYQPAMPQDFALEEIEANAGSQFDPEVVAAFMSVVGSGRLSSTPLSGLPSVAVS